jgi:PII-like signaling protein
MNNMIKQENVILVRVYTDEGDNNVSSILEKLRQREDVVGATIFRGIAGFGDRGTVHQASLLDLVSDLPIIIEFYHKEENCDDVINFIHAQIKNAHIICWPVNLSFEHIQ